MTKHLIPRNDVLPHKLSQDCECSPYLASAVIRHEMVIFYYHRSFDCMDVCEKVGIKTSEVWDLQIGEN